MMFDIVFIGFLFLFSILCFIEFIVFNEEILLALCFFCFIFFCFNTLSISVSDNFNSRASKFESDLLISFNSNKNSLIASFNSYFQTRGFSVKFKFLLFSIVSFLNISKSHSTLKLSTFFFASAFSKLTEFLLFESNLALKSQSNSITTLLYPLIFKTVTDQRYILEANLTNITLVPATNKILFLKSFS
jgi:hypothetical protein